jgi:hypothetical protein
VSTWAHHSFCNDQITTFSFAATNFWAQHEAGDGQEATWQLLQQNSVLLNLLNVTIAISSRASHQRWVSSQRLFPQKQHNNSIKSLCAFLPHAF